MVMGRAGSFQMVAIGIRPTRRDQARVQFLTACQSRRGDCAFVVNRHTRPPSNLNQNKHADLFCLFRSATQKKSLFLLHEFDLPPLVRRPGAVLPNKQCYGSQVIDVLKFPPFLAAHQIGVTRRKNRERAFSRLKGPRMTREWHNLYLMLASGVKIESGAGENLGGKSGIIGNSCGAISRDLRVGFWANSNRAQGWKIAGREQIRTRSCMNELIIISCPHHSRRKRHNSGPSSTHSATIPSPFNSACVTAGSFGEIFCRESALTAPDK